MPQILSNAKVTNLNGLDRKRGISGWITGFVKTIRTSAEQQQQLSRSSDKKIDDRHGKETAQGSKSTSKEIANEAGKVSSSAVQEAKADTASSKEEEIRPKRKPSHKERKAAIAEERRKKRAEERAHRKAHSVERKAARESKRAARNASETKVTDVESVAASPGDASKIDAVPAKKARKVKKTVKTMKSRTKKTEDEKPEVEEVAGTTLYPKEVPFTALPVEQPPVPRLAHNLDRVLFNHGVYNLRDRYSGVYNFDPYLENVMPATEFNFDAIAEYKTSSEDGFLSQMAAKHELKYVGSTSSMTSMLTHFHYLISHWRELDLSMLSRGFTISETRNWRNFTEIYRAPQAIFLRYKNGTYAIDADKEFSTPNVLMALGQSLEKLLTLPTDVFERFRKSDPRGVPKEERDAPQSYHYSKQGKILMRSQLDAHDPRLPGSGVFDLKTRAVLPIRMSAREYEDMTGYQILSENGLYESYEREFYDMFRSTFLKYSLQVRMGRMEGIFIAYHNIEEIFGFQFMNVSDMDKVLHGQEDPCLGDQEFRASLHIVHDILDQATAEFPEKSIRLHFDTRAGVVPMMYIFAEPMEEEEIDRIQNSTKDAVRAFERELRGKPEAEDNSTSSSASDAQSTSVPSADEESKDRPLLAWTLNVSSQVNGVRVPRPHRLRPEDKWELKYELSRIAKPEKARSFYNMTKARRKSVLDWGSSESSTNKDTAGASSTTADVTKQMDGVSLADAMKGSDSASGKPATKKKRSLPRFYIDLLRRLAHRGRAIREERLRAAEGAEKIVVGLDGQGHTPTGTPSWAAKEEQGPEK